MKICVGKVDQLSLRPECSSEIVKTDQIGDKYQSCSKLTQVYQTNTISVPLANFCRNSCDNSVSSSFSSI